MMSEVGRTDCLIVSVFAVVIKFDRRKINMNDKSV